MKAPIYEPKILDKKRFKSTPKVLPNLPYKAEGDLSC
jgi:hypothetical protein